MKLRELHIRTMPGFEREGFALTALDAGLNVVVGPNGSGKTTTCRAIRGLIWPDTLDKVRPVSIESIWDDDGQVLRIERQAERTAYQRDGTTAAAPPVPGSHLAECFTVTVDDLFDGSRADQKLAERVARQMAGGYDLGAIRQGALLKLPARYGRTESDALRQAKEAVRQITAQQEHLRAEEATLAELEQREQATRGAEARHKRLDTVRELNRLKGQLAEINRQLEDFPSGMDRLQGDEPARLRQLATDLANEETASRNAEDTLQQAGQQLAEAALPEEGVPRHLLDELDARLERLAGLEHRIAERERAFDESELKCEQALRVLSPAGTPEALDNLDLAGLDQLDAFHREADRVAAGRRAAEAQLDLLGEPAEAADMESITEGLHLLRQWFEVSPPSAPAEDGRRRILLWALIGGLALLSIVLAVTGNPWWILLLLAAGVAAWLAAQPAAAPPRDERAVLRERFARLPLPPPAAWDQKAVGRRVNELERSLAEARTAESREEWRRSLLAQMRRIEQAEQAIDVKRRELITRFGVAPDTSDLALTILAGQLAAYQQSRAAAREAAGELARLRTEYKTELQAANERLSCFGFEPASDLAEARPRKVELARRAAQHREACANRATAETQLADTRRRIGELQDRQRELFRAAGLDAPDTAELQRRVQRLPEYRRLCEERLKASAQRDGRVAELADEPELLEMSLDQVEQRSDELKLQAEGYRALVEQIKEIHGRIDAAAAANTLEDAVAAADRATDALYECRERAETAAAARLLLDDVEGEYRIESQPPVIRRAAEWFNGFTRGRYGLRVAETDQGAPPLFRALDTAAQIGLAPDELSRGTRMQLLLAVRLAFAVEAEHGTRLPILLDEVLSSSDPERFAAIAECVLALVERGRQVFYFTCQPSDAAAWHEMADRRGMALRSPIDLAAIRRLPPGETELLSRSTVAVEPVPAPEGRSLSDYAAALGVPRLDPSLGAAPAHLAHLVDDAETLHRLLRASVANYGSLRAMASHGQVDALIGPAELGPVDARGRVLDAFAAAWRIGRGTPLTREVLTDAGVTATFIDPICSLAADLQWDAARLIAAIDARDDERTRGFQKRTRDRMVEHLTGTGHLASDEPLSKESLRARVLSAANDDVRRGVLTWEEAAALVDRFWTSAENAL